MVELRVKLGPKGQVVIPKIFRDYYKIYPNQEVIIQEADEGVIIKKEKKEDPIKVLERIAEIATQRRKEKKLKVDPHAIYEQYEKRAKRAGL